MSTPGELSRSVTETIRHIYLKEVTAHVLFKAKTDVVVTASETAHTRNVLGHKVHSLACANARGQAGEEGMVVGRDEPRFWVKQGLVSIADPDWLDVDRHPIAELLRQHDAESW